MEAVDDPALSDDFKSDLASGKRPFRREKVYPELQDGMSMFGSLAAARDLWQPIYEAAAERGQEVRMGSYVAEVELDVDQGFEIEDLGEPGEHLTVWGEQTRLASAVGRIYPAASPSE